VSSAALNLRRFAPCEVEHGWTSAYSQFDGQVVCPRASGSSVTQTLHGSPAQSFSLSPKFSMSRAARRASSRHLVDRKDRSRPCQTSCGRWPCGNSASPCSRSAGRRERSSVSLSPITAENGAMIPTPLALSAAFVRTIYMSNDQHRCRNYASRHCFGGLSSPDIQPFNEIHRINRDAFDVEVQRAIIRKFRPPATTTIQTA
jgi:hypothetical protein